jgi:hypothetical protein
MNTNEMDACPKREGEDSTNVSTNINNHQSWEGVKSAFCNGKQVWGLVELSYSLGRCIGDINNQSCN